MRAAVIRFALWLLRQAGPLRQSSELGDVLAYLERRKRRADTIYERGFDDDWRARAIASELAVTIGDLRAGLHHGQAEIAALAGVTNDAD